MKLDEHARDGILEQYSLGTLPDAEVEKLEEHLLVCSACRDRLEETDAFVEAMRQAALKLQLEPPSPWTGRLGSVARWFARPAPKVAAVAAVLLLLLWAVRPWRAGAPDSGPAVSVLLQATRGGEALAGAHAPAGKPLLLTLDATGLAALPSYHLQIVDSHGAAVLESDIRPANGGLRFTTRKLNPGSYWVRLSEPFPHGALLREFGLAVR